MNQLKWTEVAIEDKSMLLWLVCRMTYDLEMLIKHCLRLLLLIYKAFFATGNVACGENSYLLPFEDLSACS